MANGTSKRRSNPDVLTDEQIGATQGGNPATLTDEQMNQIPEFDIPDYEDPQSVRQWAMQQMGQFGLGAAKQVAKIGDAPARLFGAEPLPQLEPTTPGQHAGSFLTEAASYFLPTGLEKAAAEKTGELAKKLYRPLRSALGRTGARTAIAGANIGTRAAIGGATAGATAFANQSDPKVAAEWGTALTGLFAAIPPQAREYVRDLARQAMARGIQPGSFVSKMLAQKIIDPLLEAGAAWFRPKGMRRIGQAVSREASAAKAAEEAGVFPHAEMMYDPLEQKLKGAGESAFLTGRTPQGVPIPNNPEQASMNQAYNDFIENYVQPKVRTDPMTGERFINAQQLDLSKRVAQNYAASHGKAFLDMPREAAQQIESRAEEVFSNAARPELEDFMGQKWADANKRLHLGILMEELGGEAMGKELGQKPQLAERMFGGYGWHMGGSPTTMRNELPGILTRLYRRLVTSPAFQTHEAKILWKLANSGGWKAGQAAALLNGMIDRFDTASPEEMPAAVQPGETIQVNPNQETVNQPEEYQWTGPGKTTRIK